MPKSAGYVSPEYLRKSAELAGKLKQESYRQMRIKADSHVLDLGCGPGLDTIPLARLVGKAGRVVGIDIDEAMLLQADDYAEQEGVSEQVKHQQADILSLPFADNSFDAVRAERLFQVLPESYVMQDVFKEIYRVVKPGGYIVLVDADWATASVDYPDDELERRLMTFFASSMRPNGFAGRQFYRLLIDNTMQDISVLAYPLVLNDYSLTPFQQWLVDEACKNNIATQDEMHNWLSTLSADDEQNRFYSTVNMNIVSGRK